LCSSIDDAIEIAAASLASGLAIEASSYPKPGNVSPIGDAKKPHPLVFHSYLGINGNGA